MKINIPIAFISVMSNGLSDSYDFYDSYKWFLAEFSVRRLTMISVYEVHSWQVQIGIKEFPCQ